jgi:Rrf2 family iron-sulfur cluster assembly transcriptional regulator
MICSRSAEYAIRAVIHLATLPQGQLLLSRKIAEETGIPAHFLAKILQDLARRGFLRSVKGPSGGFCLKRPAERIALVNIVDAVDGPAAFERCLEAFEECNAEAPCGLHDGWIALRSRIMDYLERTTIAEAAAAQRLKVRAAEKQRKPRRTARRVV